MEFSALKTFVSNVVPDYRNKLLKTNDGELGAAHLFAVVHTSWTNGTVKNMNREVVRTVRVLVNNRHRPICK